MKDIRNLNIMWPIPDLQPYYQSNVSFQDNCNATFIIPDDNMGIVLRTSFPYIGHDSYVYELLDSSIGPIAIVPLDLIGTISCWRAMHTGPTPARPRC